MKIISVVVLTLFLIDDGLPFQEVGRKELDVVPNITVTEDMTGRAPSSPCSCGGGQCGCCTGMLLSQFNINIQQKGCVNVTYDPDEFAFNMALSVNDRILYSNSISGKNPRPMCVPLPRFPSVRFCVKFYNVYFIDRNVHACIDTKVTWNDYALFENSLDCVRLGVNGVAIVKPEEGGGLPQGDSGESSDSEDENAEDYDEEDY